MTGGAFLLLSPRFLRREMPFCFSDMLPLGGMVAAVAAAAVVVVVEVLVEVVVTGKRKCIMHAVHGAAASV